MKTIKIWFTDFYEGFDPKSNYFLDILSEIYTVKVQKNDPDFLIYSCYGRDFLNFNCIRIYYTGENLVPDFNLCDYAIGFHYINFEDRYLRFPNFVLVRDQFNQLLDSKKIISQSVKSKQYFCNFIYANGQANPARDQFFEMLSDYKTVSSPGSHLNNIKIDIGGRYSKDWMYSKLDFQSRCKFSIAFENSSANGYTTEKIMHAFISKTIPIYWGNPLIEKDFNPKAMINCHNFKNFDEVVKKVKEIDQNEELYNSILSEPVFIKNRIPEEFSEERLIVFFRSIFDQNLEDARKRPLYGTTKKYENEIRNRKTSVSILKKVKNLFD
ncbi:glycosyltransferase family 10 [Gramella lutea]|uniref:Glycosyltransferase family 10 n=1 Tax=Christiangramia lutea TaxID=1607951 RepID=A0A9X2ABX0_9FLAO|nr:glycosyltransferase family 10 [Christiangramia lutea]MCH4823782.1 glycosyltransferase family 10 [Christiangramia lutea]